MKKEHITYKIWDKKDEQYIHNGCYGRADYDCFPENAVRQIAGRLLGKGNYEIHEFSLTRIPGIA